MNQLAFIINFSLSLFIASAYAQATTKHNSNIFRWNLAIVIGVLSFVFIFIFVIIIYAYFFHITVPAILTNYRGLDGQTYSSSKLSGLDKAVIGSLPSFRFSSLKGSKEGLECTICISIFQDNEVLRLLPNCKHAFHKNCIDEWLERKSSCPLCRYKFKVEDLSRFTFPSDLGVHFDPSNLEDANFEVFVQREEEPLETTSKFSLGSSFKKFVKAKKEAALIQEGDHRGYDLGKVLLDKFKHKIIVSDIVYKRRWSDLNSSDLLCLSSEMISITSSQRFSPSNDHITLRIDDSEVSSHLNLGSNKSITSRLLLNPVEMRSMSDITSFARFKEISKRNSNEESSGNADRMRRIWLDIARKTIHGFAIQRRNSLESESKRHLFNV